MMGLLQVVGTEKSGQDMAGAVYAYVKCIRFQFTWPNWNSSCFNTFVGISSNSSNCMLLEVIISCIQKQWSKLRNFDPLCYIYCQTFQGTFISKCYVTLNNP